MPKTPHTVAAALSLAAFAAASPALADEKFALAMMHFNVQYVAGGMVGYYSTPNPGIDLSAEQIEDAIVVESLAPVLALLKKHPTWGADVEMQGYMLDVMAARHPATLALLRDLAKTEQIDVDSFHYSDQLFLAYPASDLLWSQELTAKTFAKHDVPLSKTVFCQEGQSGMGLAQTMKERGYETFVWPKNLWIFQHGEFDAAPLYTFGEISMIVGAKGVDFDANGTKIRADWTFFDDGELLATGDTNPYLPDIFHFKQKSVDDYEAKVAALEAQGYSISTVSKYVAAIKGLVTPATPPPLLDGTWQPNSTSGVLRWLGGYGLWGIDERDNHVRSLGAIAHRELTAAKAIVTKAGLDDGGALDDARRLLALGQVSDATGINPFRGEAEYGIAHFTEAIRIARDLIAEAKEKLALGVARIDPTSGKVTEGGDDGLRGEQSEAALKLTIDGAARAVSERWEKVATGLHRVEITFAPGDSRGISVRFPGEAIDKFVTTRALDDVLTATFNRAEFTFDSFHLALPIGMISLGSGRFVIKDQAFVHVAAQIFRESGDVVFADETAPLAETATWVFYVRDGIPSEAGALARAINDKRALLR